MGKKIRKPLQKQPYTSVNSNICTIHCYLNCAPGTKILLHGITNTINSNDLLKEKQKHLRWDVKFIDNFKYNIIINGFQIDFKFDRDFIKSIEMDNNYDDTDDEIIDSIFDFIEMRCSMTYYGLHRLQKLQIESESNTIVASIGREPTAKTRTKRAFATENPLKRHES